MGTSIHTWLEVDKGQGFELVEKPIVEGHYDIFGLLFGVENYANFEPAAPKRGLPEGVSEDLVESLRAGTELSPEVFFGDDQELSSTEMATALVDASLYHYCTWISLEEIVQIDWSQRAKDYDSRTHFYDSDGNYLSKSLLFDIDTEEGIDNEKLEEEKEIEITLKEEVDGLEEGDKLVLKQEKLKREDALSKGWRNLFDEMREYGEDFGQENVRLIACFSN